STASSAPTASIFPASDRVADSCALRPHLLWVGLWVGLRVGERATQPRPPSHAGSPRRTYPLRILGVAYPRIIGLLRTTLRRALHMLSSRSTRVGGAASRMTRRSYDIVIIGSGAGGGTVAQELSSLCRDGVRIAVLEKGPKLRDEEFTGREVEMATALYEDGGGFLTAEQTMTLAFGSAYGGSTVVYTGT